MAATDHAPLLERAFDLELHEGSWDLEASSGEVPSTLRGTYYLNSPANTRRGELCYRHWLDGDGMVSALRFAAGGVRLTSRLVRSTKWVREEEAGRPLFRAFGTRFAGDRLKRGVGLESPVNVSVYPWRGTLLAFGEQGLPWELDPETLETRGEYTFGRRLNPITPLSAHPHFDPASGEMFNFGVSFSARHPSLTLFRFAADGSLALRRRLPLEHPSSMHDFGLAPRHAVFYQSPYLLAVDELLTGGRTLLESLNWRPELGSRLLVLRRDDGEPVAEVAIGEGYCLHFIGCFETAEGHLGVDVIELERPVYDQYEIPDRLFVDVRRARPRRYVVDLGAAEVVAEAALDYRLMCDFPAIDRRRAMAETRDFWVLGISASERPGRKFFDQLAHLAWHGGADSGANSGAESGAADIYQAPPGYYLGGEPVFLPDPASDGGTVICQRFDAVRRQSAFLLFDAFDVAGGPRAVLPLPHPQPFGFHASYDPRR